MAETQNKTEIPPDLLKQVLNPWLVGADPEFSVLRPPTYEMVTNGEGGTPVNFASEAGAIGWDHGGRIWEARPTADQSAYGVVLNCWRLFRDARMAPIERFKWKSGGLANADHNEGDTIGGHVHFGFRRWTDDQLPALVNTTTLLEQLDILPSRESARRREIQPAYGRLDGWRDSGGHVEYRAPASWLDKPGQALAVLTTMKLVATEPSAAKWDARRPRTGYMDWLGAMSQRDVDAFLLYRLIEKQGLGAIQADPGTDFRNTWRKEYLWSK